MPQAPPRFYRLFVELYGISVEFYRNLVELYGTFVELYGTFVELYGNVVEYYGTLVELYRNVLEYYRLSVELYGSFIGYAEHIREHPKTKRILPNFLKRSTTERCSVSIIVCGVCAARKRG